MVLVVYRVEPINDIMNKETVIGRKLKQKDYIIFSRQFSTLIHVGILLVDAVDLWAE